MRNAQLIAHACGHALLACGYTAGVAWILFNGQRLFGKGPTFLIPLAVLLLFVVSATVVGTLVLGRPALLYFNGKKQEAVRFFGYTVAWLILFTMLVLAAITYGSRLAGVAIGNAQPAQDVDLAA